MDEDRIVSVTIGQHDPVFCRELRLINPHLGFSRWRSSVG